MSKHETVFRWIVCIFFAAVLFSFVRCQRAVSSPAGEGTRSHNPQIQEPMLYNEARTVGGTIPYKMPINFISRKRGGQAADQDGFAWDSRFRGLTDGLQSKRVNLWGQGMEGIRDCLGLYQFRPSADDCDVGG